MGSVAQAGSDGAARTGAGSCGGADAHVDDAGAGMPVLTWRDHRWGRPSPGSGAAVHIPRVAP
jgi:hypothetical protein